MSDWFFEPLIPLYYEMIVVDPAVGFKLYSAKGEKKSPQAQYAVMTDADILALPIGSLASMDCLLLLWATAPKLPLALDCINAWGFQYKSLMVWRKLTKNGKVRWGPGYRVRSTGEVVLVATLGNPKQAIVPPTIFDGEARQHSRKPDSFYALAERIMPQARRADIFSRQRRPGWDNWGDEVEKYPCPETPSITPPARTAATSAPTPAR
jgi:N6-adenosine-specific RNA methylase IME4